MDLQSNSCENDSSSFPSIPVIRKYSSTRFRNYSKKRDVDGAPTICYNSHFYSYPQSATNVLELDPNTSMFQVDEPSQIGSNVHETASTRLPNDFSPTCSESNSESSSKLSDRLTSNRSRDTLRLSDSALNRRGRSASELDFPSVYRRSSVKTDTDVPNFFSLFGSNFRLGINMFNQDPIKGISFLIFSNCIGHEPCKVADFLRKNSYISKRNIGDLLGSLKIPFCVSVLDEYVRLFDPSGKKADEALRLFQTYFRMPGEAQKISHILEKFSEQYVACNLETNVYPNFKFEDTDTYYVLSYAMIMLNVDRHNPQVKNKMSVEDFITNVRSAECCHSIPDDVLTSIYENINRHEFMVGHDHTNQLKQLEMMYSTKYFKIDAPHRQLIKTYDTFDIQFDGKSKIHRSARTMILFSDVILFVKKLTRNTAISRDKLIPIKSVYFLKDIQPVYCIHKTKTYLAFKLISQNIIKCVLSFNETQLRNVASQIQSLILDGKKVAYSMKNSPKGILSKISDGEFDETKTAEEFQGWLKGMQKSEGKDIAPIQTIDYSHQKMTIFNKGSDTALKRVVNFMSP